VRVADIKDGTIALKPSNSNLNEVVVVGYATQKRETITGSVSTLKKQGTGTLPKTKAW
jgi:hypothetical protein